MSDLTTVFLKDHASRLSEHYVGRIARALEPLSEEDVWWRPHEGMTSVGNLLLHLEGNVRQWVLSGIGGAADHRERASEFAATEGSPKADLLDALRATTAAAAGVIEGLDEATLLRQMEIQGIATTGYDAVAHVVEHFSWHVGQIVWIAKARAGPGHGIAFYDDAELNAARND